jgi:hypothetical protein
LKDEKLVGFFLAILGNRSFFEACGSGPTFPASLTLSPSSRVAGGDIVTSFLSSIGINVFG